MSLIGKVVEFITQTNTRSFGIVSDKIIISGPNTMYMIADLKGGIHIVAPLDMIRIIEEESSTPQQTPQQSDLSNTGDVFDLYLKSKGSQSDDLSAKERALQKNKNNSTNQQEPNDLPF